MERVKKKIHCLDEIESLVDRFKGIVGARHNKELAQLLGISDKDFSNRKYKGTLSRLIVDWAVNQRMDINRLVYGEGEEEFIHSQEAERGETSIEEKKIGGENSIHYEGIEGCCLFMRELIIRISTSPKNIFLMTANSNSMEPTIHNGETVMIDTGRTSINEGGLFVLRMYDNILIKRVSLRPGDKVKIISDNKEYDSYEVPKQDIQVIAQVIWIARLLVGGH